MSLNSFQNKNPQQVNAPNTQILCQTISSNQIQDQRSGNRG